MIRQPAAKYTTPGAGRNLPAAIGVGLALLAPIVVGLVWVDWIFILYVTAMLCLGALEVSHALARREMHAEIVPIVAGTAVTLLGIYWVTANPGLGIAPVTFIVSSLGGTVLAAIIGRLFRGDPTGFVPDIAASAFVIAYIPLIGLFVALLLAPADGAQRIWTLIVCVICSDTGAYVIGVLFGRHKLAPRISPGKTWEGVLGGLACTVVAGVICATWLLGIPWWVGIPLGIAPAPPPRPHPPGAAHQTRHRPEGHVEPPARPRRHHGPTRLDAHGFPRRLVRPQPRDGIVT